MLKTKEAMATVPVRDLKRSRKFYEEALGLTPARDPEPQMVGYQCGRSVLFVYESPHAGTNKATCATWNLGEDITEIAAALAQRGVVFEHYDDIPAENRQGDVYVFGEIKTAWFADPDGNIHALTNG
ncbi:VOC family protein [Aquamicrobium sp. LC103]|uniref:VOC family protein n=1 Tax=Aquamicrobium sp. LC103 TaxID=1120658 RepID=UPI00063E7911|nr:VOC family protein [Aquamicrobium sp. LC103]TKT80176.1 glyoxalase/bleomycin resistance/dioxygenase family protein [Aquamicrobium sp. LC103]